MMSFDGLPLRARRPLLSLLLPVLVAFGCDCVGERLVIVDPGRARVFTETDDLDPEATGLQIEVEVDVTGVAAGREIRLHVGLDADTLLTTGTVFRSIVQPDGRATVPATLPTGTVFLRACVGEGTSCATKSPLRETTVVGSLGGCAFVRFLEPVATDAPTLVLGASADASLGDGACGTSFAIPVRASVDGPDGSTATLFVDGIPTASATVTNGEVRFAAVQLGVRGADETSVLTLQVGDELDCAVSFAQPIAVDCAGPSCRLQRPIEGIYLNSTLDADPATAVLDLNVKADGSLETAGEDSTLFDGSTDTTLATATATSSGSVATSTFLGVSFPDGPARYYAGCSDGTLTTHSAVASYLVDATGCTIDFDEPVDGSSVTNADDSDSDPTNGIQIEATMSTAGDECTVVRAAPCSSIAAEDFTAVVEGQQSAVVDVGTSGTQSICAEIQDVAGNVGRDQIAISVVPNGQPVVAIVSPTAATRINVAGGTGFVADLTPATTSCELSVTVDCSAVGTAVSLRLDGSVGETASATCTASSASPLGGRASFGSVSIPASASPNHTLVARQTIGSLTGVSPTIAIGADCAPPTLTLTTPATCPATFGAADDVDAGAAGVQIDAVVSSPNTPQLDVIVRVAESGGGVSTRTSLAASLPANATAHDFDALDLGGSGTKSVTASATDAFANSTTTTACAMTVTDLPSIVLTAPPVTTFNAANAATHDCDTSNTGFDLTVSGTTNATAGSQVTLRIGAAAPVLRTVSGGGFTGCVPAPQGTSNITAVVVDTVPEDGTSGTANAIPIQIVVATDPPSNAIHPLTITTLDRRAGVMRFEFTALGDSAGQPFVSYEIRCADSEILNEAMWTAAATHPFDAHTPGNPGASEVLTVRGFHTGTTEICSVRATDGGGNRTPIPNAIDQTAATPAFLIATYAGTVAGGSIGVAGARAVGDVNGDSIPDFVVSGRRSAYLFLGQAGGATPLLATTFTKTEPSDYFGSIVRGIGDFDRDGVADLAIGDMAGSGNVFDGEVFVFYGRMNWPASIVVSETGCAASFCVRGGAGSVAALGSDVVALGDFDGLAGPDLAIGMGFANRVIILSSRTGIASGTDFVIGTNDPVGFSIAGGTPANSFGWTLGAPGQITGSANADLIIGEVVPGAPSVLYRLPGQDLSVGATGLVPIAPAALATIAGGATLSSNFGTADTFGIPAGDFDGDGNIDLFAFTPDAAQVDAGVYVLYGSGTADYPITGSVRARTAVSSIAEGYFGVSRGVAYDPILGHLGDLDLDGRDELLAGGISMTTDNRFSASLSYGRAPRQTGAFAVEDQLRYSAPLQPVLESYSNASQFWTVGFVGDVVRDTATSYPDLVVCDPGTNQSGAAGTGDRFFVLY